MVVLKDVTIHGVFGYIMVIVVSIVRYICDMYCIVYKNFVTQGCKITHEWYDIYIYIYISLCVYFMNCMYWMVHEHMI